MHQVKDILLDSIFAIIAVMSAVYAAMAAKHQMDAARALTKERREHIKTNERLSTVLKENLGLAADNDKMRILLARKYAKADSDQAH